MPTAAMTLNWLKGWGSTLIAPRSEDVEVYLLSRNATLYTSKKELEVEVKLR